MDAGAYGENTAYAVDNIQSNLNWQGVQDVFYTHIYDLLMGHASPEETAAAIDRSVNAALDQGRAEL